MNIELSELQIETLVGIIGQGLDEDYALYASLESVYKQLTEEAE